MDLVKNKAHVKIADLGFAKELDYEDFTKTCIGTPIIMAPQVMQGDFYNHKADVWSLGVVFFELITGYTPFTGEDRDDLK